MSDTQNALMVNDPTQRENLHKMLSEYLITITDQLFQNRDIFIDGYRFINCSFRDCRLVILRGTFEMHHCLIVAGSRTFGEEAMKSIQLYTQGYPNLQFSTVFGANQNADGTISIGKGASIQ